MLILGQQTQSRSKRNYRNPTHTVTPAFPLILQISLPPICSSSLLLILSLYSSNGVSQEAALRVARCIPGSPC